MVNADTMVQKINQLPDFDARSASEATNHSNVMPSMCMHDSLPCWTARMAHQDIDGHHEHGLTHI